MVETRAELPFIGDQIVCLSHDQAARSADCGIAIARRMVETLAELPFIGDQVVCLSHDQAARSGPAECGREGSLQPTPTWATRLDPTKSWSGWRLLMAGGCLIGASLSPLCSEHHRSKAMFRTST
jgi:hypothetical protein